MPPPLIAGHVVARCLRVHIRTLDDWHKAGFLNSASESRRCYYESDLDSLLAANAYNFDRAPRFADLIAGRVKLLTLEEAMGILKLEGRYIATLVTRGHLPAIKYLHELRYCQASATRHAAARKELTPGQVAHVLGFASMRSIPPPVKAKLERKLKGRYSRKSVLTLLKELMPPRQSPEEWLEDRLASDKPLLSITRAAPSQTGRRRISALLNTGEIHYIDLASVPGGDRRRISPDSLLAHLEKTEQPYTKEQLASLFGSTPTNFRGWDAEYVGWRDCPVHSHHDDKLYRDCVIFILQKYLTPGASAVAWHNAWQNAWRKSEVFLVNIQQAAELLDVTKSTVLAIVQDERLAASRTPRGELRFLRSDVIRTRKKA